MLKIKFAGAVAAAVLLSAGVANAGQSAFPSSVNETKPFSFSYQGMKDVRAGAARQAFPASPSEASAFSVPVRGAERSTMVERLSRTYGMFPASVNETGPL